jgi:zinc transport system permease protein
MTDLLGHVFMQHALLTSVLSSVACGVIGTLVVVNRMSTLTGSIAHASFGGLGLAFAMGLPPMYGALAFSMLSALGIGALTRGGSRGESPDTAMAAFWATGMAAGLVFMRLSGSYAPDLMSWLFGSLLTVSRGDLVLAVLLDLIILAVVAGLFKEFVAVSYDEEFSAIRGIRTGLVRGVFLTLAAVTIVMLMKMTGLIMVMALMTIPAAVVRLFTCGVKRMMILSSMLALGLNLSGLWLAVLLDLPPGAVIILLAGLVYFGAVSFVRRRESGAGRRLQNSQ